MSEPSRSQGTVRRSRQNVMSLVGGEQACIKMALYQSIILIHGGFLTLINFIWFNLLSMTSNAKILTEAYLRAE